MKTIKLAFLILCTLVLVSNFRTMSRWSEARGVYDDICYLRQAHLFQRFGLAGIDTDLSKDDDLFAKQRFEEIGWNDPSRLPCHNPKGDKYVLQYPPGTGVLLALFPQGHQVVPLYISASVIVWAVALIALFYAPSVISILIAGGFGTLATYMMINPAKASYSIAPTMALCAIIGALTVYWLTRRATRGILLPALVGLLLGMAVNFRLPNLFLSAGYLILFAIWLFQTRKVEILVQAIGFGVALAIGMSPTLLANLINAGSPFATTYGGTDAVSPEFSFVILQQYLRDMQSVLVILAIGSTVWLFTRNDRKMLDIGVIVGGNLFLNLIFFLSHPVFTPYYTIPVAMLSLWSVVFASILQIRCVDTKSSIQVNKLTENDISA
jgi:hypothetical protein